MIETSSDESPLQPPTLKQLRKIRDSVRLQVFVMPSCTHSPAVARTAFRFAQQSNKIKTDVIEINEFPDLQQRYDIRATPTIVIDESLVLTGAMDEATLVDCLLKVVEHKPIPPGSIKPGESTPIPQGQSQEVRMAGSGLIIPR
jgi:alkyl hydroperoxide reductase subunit AhpF